MTEFSDIGCDLKVVPIGQDDQLTFDWPPRFENLAGTAINSRALHQPYIQSGSLAAGGTVLTSGAPDRYLVAITGYLQPPVDGNYYVELFGGATRRRLELAPETAIFSGAPGSSVSQVRLTGATYFRALAQYDGRVAQNGDFGIRWAPVSPAIPLTIPGLGGVFRAQAATVAPELMDIITQFQGLLEDVAMVEDGENALKKYLQARQRIVDLEGRLDIVARGRQIEPAPLDSAGVADDVDSTL